MSARRRTICTVFGFAAALVALAAPALAGATPLLSGYGGPGQGAQVILGSSLVNPPSGGGSSGAQGGAPTVSELTVAPSRSATAKGHSTHPGKSSSPSKQPAGTAAPAPPAGVRPALVAGSSSGSGGTLGLSAGDVVLILFVLFGLTVTGALTRQLTRRTL